MIRLVAVYVSMMFLAGCMTITGIPREENVIYTEDNAGDIEYDLSGAVAVGEISHFLSTSIITLAFKTNPNLNNKNFGHYLSQSLQNAGLLGVGYTLNAELVESDNFGLGLFAKPSVGKISRNIEIKYTLLDAKNNIVFSEVITGDGNMTNSNLFYPYHLIEREAAEKGYGDNIRQIIELLRAYKA